MAGAAPNTQNTYTIRTLEDDIKGGQGETGTFQAKAVPAPTTIASPPPPTGGPGTSAGTAPTITPPPMNAGSPAPLPGTTPPPASPTAKTSPLKGRSKLAASAMKGSKGGSRKSLYIAIAVIALLFIGGSAAYYFTQIAPTDTSRTSTSKTTDDSSNTDDNSDDSSDDTDKGATTSLGSIESAIPSSYGYFLTLIKGSQTDGKGYEFQQEVILENTFSSEIFSTLSVDLSSFTWNTNELYYVPNDSEEPSKTNNSLDALVLLSVDRETEAEEFISTLKNHQYADIQSSTGGKDVIGIVDDNNTSLYFVEFSDYILMSGDEKTILNALDLIENGSSNVTNNKQGLDQISSVTYIKITISSGLKTVLSQKTDPLNLNFYEFSLKFPTEYIDWNSLNGFYLYSIHQDGYVFAIDTVIQEFPDKIPQWEPIAFEYMKGMFPGINVQGDMQYINEDYEGYFKRYVNLHEYGAATQSSLTYCIMENHMFVGSTPSAFSEVTKAYLNTSMSVQKTSAN